MFIDRKQNYIWWSEECVFTHFHRYASFPGAEISKNIIKYYSLLNIILSTALCILFFQTFWLWKQKQSCRHIKNNLIAFLGGPLNIEVDWKTKILTQIQAKHNFASTVHSSKVVRFKIGHDLTTSKCNRWWPCLFIFQWYSRVCSLDRLSFPYEFWTSNPRIKFNKQQ